MSWRASQMLATLIPETAGVFDLYGFAVLLLNRVVEYVDITSFSMTTHLAFLLVVVISLGGPSVSFVRECVIGLGKVARGGAAAVEARFERYTAREKAETAIWNALLAWANRLEGLAKQEIHRTQP